MTRDDVTFRVNDHGRVIEVIRRETRTTESMVYDVDRIHPYTMWGGRRFYLDPDAAVRARVVYGEYRSMLHELGMGRAYTQSTQIVK